MQEDETAQKLSDSAIAVLGQLLDNAIDPATEISMSKFRAKNYLLVKDMDNLEARNLIQRKENHYQIKALALLYLDTTSARKLIADIEALYIVLKSHYLDVQEAPMPVVQLCQEANIPATRAIYALKTMLDMSLWSAGYATDLSTPEAYVLASERVLEYPNFISMVVTVSNWKTPNTSVDWMSKLATSVTSDVAPSSSSPATSQAQNGFSFESLLHPAIQASSLRQFNDGYLREAALAKLAQRQRTLSTGISKRPAQMRNGSRTSQNSRSLLGRCISRP